MKRYFLFLLIPIMSGCFKDEPKLPRYYAKQEIDVAYDSVICYSGEENFDYFILNCSQPFDSVHWYDGYQNQVFLGSGQPYNLPNVPFEWSIIKCIGFSDTDTTELLLELNYCTRHMYIPIAFTPDGDGINEVWQPFFIETTVNGFYKPHTVHLEIRTQDGIKVFEADDLQNGWNGEFTGYTMPPGIYFYLIDLNISGEDPVEYTGWLKLVG